MKGREREKGPHWPRARLARRWNSAAAVHTRAHVKKMNDWHLRAPPFVPSVRPPSVLPSDYLAAAPDALLALAPQIVDMMDKERIEDVVRFTKPCSPRWRGSCSASEGRVLLAPFSPALR